MPELRAAVYARIRPGSETTEAPTKRLREYAELRSWRVVETFVDIARASDDARPQLSRLLAAAERHDFDIVIFPDFDPFGRSLRHSIFTLERLEYWGLQLCFEAEGICSKSDAGVKAFAMLKRLAHAERERIGEKIGDGMVAAKGRGVWTARPPARLDDARILADYQTLKSYRRAARLHGVSERTVRRIVAGTRAPGARAAGIFPRKFPKNQKP